MRIVLQILAILSVVVVIGIAGILAMNKDIPDYAVPDLAWQNGTELDGMVFFTNDRVLESGDEIIDALRFKDGTFQSAMCQVYCDFGWHDYQTFVEGATIHFAVTTRCPDAPHTVVFYGTIIDGIARFEGTWTTRRWYWAHQVNVVGQGGKTPSPEHLAAGLTL